MPGGSRPEHASASATREPRSAAFRAQSTAHFIVRSRSVVKLSAARGGVIEPRHCLVMVFPVRALFGVVVVVVVASCSAPIPLSLPGARDGAAPDAGNQVVGCSPGVSATCTCPGNAQGLRVCQDDGTYTPCQCVDARVPCFPGAVQGCDCGEGFAGIQFCGEDSIFTGCVCPDLPDAAAAPDVAHTDAGIDASPDVSFDAARPDITDVPVVDVPADVPAADVCTCAPDASRLCPLPTGQVEATYRNGRCRRGTQGCAGAACWGPCLGQVDPIDEICNQIDDNCNGIVDDIVVSCGLGRCRRVVATCVNGQFTPCMPDFTQRRAETCNGIDDDCNGMIDDACRDQ